MTKKTKCFQNHVCLWLVRANGRCKQEHGKLRGVLGRLNFQVAVKIGEAIKNHFFSIKSLSIVTQKKKNLITNKNAHKTSNKISHKTSKKKKRKKK